MLLCCLLSIVGKSLECVEKLRKVNPCKSWQCSVCFESWQIGGSKVPFVRSFVFWSFGLPSWWRLKKTLFLKNTHVILERDVVGDDVVSAVFLSDFISGQVSHFWVDISMTTHKNVCVGYTYQIFENCIPTYPKSTNCPNGFLSGK